jgi:hypothetical protein
MAQSVLALALTYHIFRNNTKQKTAERKAAWFHKVAVDPSIEKCFDYFGVEISFLDEAANACEQLKYQDNAALNALVTARLQEFRSRLTPIRSGVSDLALIFDTRLRQSIFDRFNLLEDEVAEWFDKLQLSKPADPRESLSNMVTSCQSDVLKLLREYEFREWSD